jgi:hypothetical protein
MSKEAMKLALEALKGYRRELNDGQPCDAEKALEEALKQEKCDCKDPSQCWEPCGRLGKSEEHVQVYQQEQGEPDYKTLAIQLQQQRTWVGLTEKEFVYFCSYVRPDVLSEIEDTFRSKND